MQLQQQAQASSPRSTAFSTKANTAVALDDEHLPPPDVTYDENAFSNAAERVLSEANGLDDRNTEHSDQQLESWRQKAQKIVSRQDRVANTLGLTHASTVICFLLI